jgi:hypothetical protein
MPRPVFVLGFLLAAAAAVTASGCHSYEDDRPPVDQLTSGDKGLQSKDVVDASDKLVMDLLKLPEVNASPTQLTVVFAGVENRTSEPSYNYDIFLERLRVKVAQYGRGRIAIIDNRDRVGQLQQKELDPAPAGGGDRFGQGGMPPPAPTGPGGIQPEYALYAKFSDLPNRKTNYYYASFTLTNLRTRQVAWANDYEVKVAR